MPHNPDHLKSLMKNYFHRAYTQKDASVIDEVIAENVLNHGLAAEPTRTRDAFKSWYTAFSNSFSNVECHASHVFVEGDWVTARVVFKATHTGPHLGPPPSHKPVTLTALVLCRFQNNKVVEAYNEFNQLALMQQITT